MRLELTTHPSSFGYVKTQFALNEHKGKQKCWYQQKVRELQYAQSYTMFIYSRTIYLLHIYSPEPA